MTNLAGVYSEVAAYEFTTLTTVPGDPACYKIYSATNSTVKYGCLSVQESQLPETNSSKPPFSTSNVSIVGAKNTNSFNKS